MKIHKLLVSTMLLASSLTIVSNYALANENTNTQEIHKGAYTTGDAVWVDVNEPSDDYGKTLEEIYGPQPSTNQTSASMEDMAEETPKHGTYAIGDTLYIDASELNEDSGKTLEEIYGPQKNAREASMPSADKVWDWSKGTYTGTFEINYMYSYTRYRFTGYSTYNVITDEISREPDNGLTPGNYSVYLMKGSGSGSIAKSYKVTDYYANFKFYNCDPKTAYAFAVGKANDGSLMKCSISIKGA